eukprot:8021420-Heterocapsa_arctica.AAC.1
MEDIQGHALAADLPDHLARDLAELVDEHGWAEHEAEELAHSLGSFDFMDEVMLGEQRQEEARQATQEQQAIPA